VLDAARELNYQPNRIAQGLRTGKTNTIGLIIADIANPFFGMLGREIEKEAASHGYRIIFCSSDENAEKSALQIAMLQQSQVDGYIICPPIHSEEQIWALENMHVPYVLVDRYFPGIDSNTVMVDNFEGAYQATSHLIKLGRTRIANITVNLDLINMSDRTGGYRKALTDHGIAVDESLIKVLPFSHNNRDVKKAIAELTGNGNELRMDAILFSTSKIGIMGIECLTEMNIEIPDDVAVVSFDDADAYRICRSPVTVVAQPLREMGQQAVQLLLREIAHPEENWKTQKIILKTGFIVRKSCGSN
jgi:LacI family transcriptional regulator